MTDDTKDRRFQEFLDSLDESLRSRRLGDVDAEDVRADVTREEALVAEVLDCLSDGGYLPDLDIAFFEQKIGRANARISAYGVSTVDGRADLVVVVRNDKASTDRSPTIPASKITQAARSALHVLRSSRDALHLRMEPSSPATDMFATLHEHREAINSVRVIVLVEGSARPVAMQQPDDLPAVRLDIWDHVRLERVLSSGLPYEAITISILDHLGEPISFVDSGFEASDHHCYLAVLPGDLLYDLYDEHGARLLELNVRSFLQARGKVNKGIRSTLKEDPEHFLAYNNGISATVEHIEFASRSDGTKGISELRGLQIVNGGQTTASIHRARKQDGVDLTRVGVQAKITVVRPEQLDTLVPNISRFSNTQNKVNETDFSANHPYHVQLQQLSERVWAPGETTRWFYERARGQWEVARSRDGTTLARRRQFDAQTPKRQRIDKALLARSENSWRQKPHIVSRGGQKNFIEFMTELGESLPDEEDYRKVIARVILYKAAEKVARRIGFSAYRANAVTYTVALLVYRTNARINLGSIWAHQAISRLIENVLEEWMPRVHDMITESATERGKNVTEWAKQPDCWATIQATEVEVPDELRNHLREGLALPNVGAFRDGARTRSLDEDEVRRQEQVMAMSESDIADIFRRVSKFLDIHGMPGGAWLAMTGCLTTVQTYAANRWTRVPSPKQTKQVLKALAFLEEREEN